MSSDEDEIELAKRLERPELDDWSHDGLADSAWWLSLVASSKQEKYYYTNLGIENARYLSGRHFREFYEDQCKPCLIKQSAVIKNDEDWHLDALSSRYGNLNWRLSDTHGAVVGLDEWIQYGKSNADDAPFALYDSEIFDDIIAFTKYARPSFVSRCDFSIIPMSQRPPWRWILLGCPRSGTGLHIDPLLTHAWVYLVQGRKLWAMLPPGTGFVEPETDRTPSANWFYHHRDRLKSRSDYIEFIQYPGETVFIPGGWEHAVLNLDWTVAITENYAKLSSDAALLAVRSQESVLYQTLLYIRQLRHKVLLDDDCLPHIIFYLPTFDVVTLAPVARAFEKAVLSSTAFWRDRLQYDLHYNFTAAAAMESMLPLAVRYRKFVHDKNTTTSRSMRALYLDILESQEEERMITGQGLC
mmetsp:Transcript_8888/g.13650  ORF Transcript_8888/g.13650 Transcript_8888/m.13650 type:complete len:413 (+) Transcript_8888:1606-2844(+)